MTGVKFVANLLPRFSISGYTTRHDYSSKSRPLPWPETYRIPDTATTPIFYDYTFSAGIHDTDMWQPMVVALNAIYHSARSSSPKVPIRVDTLSWSSGGALLDIESNGDDGSGNLTWTTLADSMLGVGTFLNQERYNTAEWQIVDETLANIGVGYIGEQLRKTLESGPAAGTANST